VTSALSAALIKAQDKKISKKVVSKEILLLMTQAKNSDHERVIFLNNHIKKSVIVLYCKTEKTKSMTYL